ncbi:pyrroloquinoline quinone biosynthesis protein PqqB [Thiohalorhabdus methylotrophus]|uniref:Coenzyme PQQ synthesis protein B n=1 Tax=Thiohalorhabdus methylotrophus TaxID=3242694 RepID=A0ABV4TYA7_9GAMM
MYVHILGSGAGGGFPQWNCNCHNCQGVRQGTISATPRSQSSIAVSADGERWALINCSPDVRDQLNAFPDIHPKQGPRGTGIAAVLLVDAQIDHTTGLLTLREGDPLELYCTEPVYQDLTTAFPLVNILGHYGGVHWHQVPTDPAESFTIPGTEPLQFTSVPLSSEAPPFSPHRGHPRWGDNIGLRIEDPESGRNLFYAPGLGKIEDHVGPFMEQADCLLVDGTAWTNDEMARAGVGSKLATDMGHLPQSGPGGMVEVLNGLERPRKILIHINNTNPILDADSPERGELNAAGIEVAHDGMDIHL